MANLIESLYCKQTAVWYNLFAYRNPSLEKMNALSFFNRHRFCSALLTDAHWPHGINMYTFLFGWEGRIQHLALLVSIEHKRLTLVLLLTLHA